MTRARGLRIVVAGAGAVGVVTALALARAGATVILADPSPPGGNASRIAAGMLAPVLECLFDQESPELGLLRRARDLWPGLAQSVGLTLERAGAMAAGNPDEVEAWAGRLADLGVDAQELSPDEVRSRAPWLTAGFGALWTSEDWRLEPPAALAALRGAATVLGVQWSSVSVSAFADGVATMSDGGRVACDALVIATGASSSLIGVAPELAAITPIKGHILRAPALTLEGPVVRLKDVYICPADGGAVVGSTMEVGRADTDVDPLSVARLRARAGAASGIFAETPLIARAGVRAATPDSLPLVGAGQAPGVWLAAGARRNGWLLAPLIAQTLVEAAVDHRTPLWARDFDPARFKPVVAERMEDRRSLSIPSPI